MYMQSFLFPMNEIRRYIYLLSYLYGCGSRAQKSLAKIFEQQEIETSSYLVCILNFEPQETETSYTTCMLNICKISMKTKIINFMTSTMTFSYTKVNLLPLQ